MKDRPPMPPDYFETHFRAEPPDPEWPAAFAVITAYAPTGEKWTIEKNEAANGRLHAELRQTGRWQARVTGYSPTTGHAEPGWAVELPLEDACALGDRYQQDAIYYVRGDALSITYCDPLRERLVPVGSFRQRLDRR